MPDTAAIATDLVAALNARDYATIAALCDEDVAISGLGAGSDQGREALRDRLARHFAALDESFGDAVVMQAAGGSPVAIRVTARGRDASATSYSMEKVLLVEIDGGRISRLSLFSDAGAAAGR
ncbi:nuclear transport factor 2 family protein [Rhizobium sp. TRM96647]|uniref:nuclear transport factor 2 family protein n=1 Tax=unclassified Rhizobium TaxID=2613769 RepID=UPI0021E95EBE|nr:MULTISPECIES: nuclear transport factor 2 family protein [unclassified Rhizobium]MCV3737969.1 nuclear transport factor 2 family protein [Rhizobium sp. TRM96647]MCV3759656.1 nuclear transport factor 2 family protein [Rhizobium sp. TRM96650]